MDSPADPSVSGTASRSHNTTAAGSSREPSQTGEREALLAFHFPPSFLPLPSLYFVPPTSGSPKPRVTGGMKTREAGLGSGLDALEAGLFRNGDQ